MYFIALHFDALAAGRSDILRAFLGSGSSGGCGTASQAASERELGDIEANMLRPRSFSCVNSHWVCAQLSSEPLVRTLELIYSCKLINI